jgi:hypothetical protein
MSDADHGAQSGSRSTGRGPARAQVWLPTDVSRQLCAIAARIGLSPAQVLAQLADQVRIDDDGALTVDTFNSP